MQAKRQIDSFLFNLLVQRRIEGRDAGDVLSMLLTVQKEEQHSQTITDRRICDHVMTFLAAGHETTANALTWTFYLLSQNQEPREKLLAELQQVLGGRTPTLEDLPHLSYLERVINEAMRLYPPVWTIGRRSIHTFDLDGYQFPPNTIFLISQWALHRHPGIWRDPDAFRPERWDPESGEHTPSWSYFPFGGGPRICIGMPFAQMEAKLLLSTILQHSTPRLVPGFHVQIQPAVTLRPKNGLCMILDPSSIGTRATSVQFISP
jgi:cytochrome P450